MLPSAKPSPWWVNGRDPEKPWWMRGSTAQTVPMPRDTNTQPWSPLTDPSQLPSRFGQVADLVPGVQDVKAALWDTPKNFLTGHPYMGLLSLATALPGVPSVVKKLDDLPMDQASRMARAREMGFDVDRPLMHGTSGEFESFDLGRVGSGASSGSSVVAAEDAIFLTNNPNAATRYAQEAGDAPSVMPVLVRGNLKRVPMMVEYDPFLVKRQLDFAREQGYDGVRFQGMGDWGHGTLDSPLIDEQIAMFDPSNIRSRFARFDPRNAGSADLLAGMGGLLAVGAYRNRNER